MRSASSRGAQAQAAPLTPRGGRACVGAVVLAAVVLVAPAGGAQPASRGRVATKLASSLARVAQSPSPTVTARRAGLTVRAGGRVRVVVETSARAGAVAAIHRDGGSVEATAGSLVQAIVPPSRLPELARNPSVRLVRAPARPVFLDLRGEGVAKTNATTWHGAGLTGAGVKVAVIDGGFGGLDDLKGAGEIPASAVSVDYCPGDFSADRHGAAVAEIVADEAPAAELYLICVDSEVTLARAERYAAEHGVRIVNHSIGWFGTARGDGSGGAGTPDGVVAAARADGILWVNAAGNEADTHWGGAFADADADRVLDFLPGEETDSVRVLGGGGQGCAELRWDNWPATGEDYDLVVRDEDGVVVAESTNHQGAGYGQPLEEACFANLGDTAAVEVAVRHVAGPARSRLDLFVVGDVGPLEYSRPDGSIVDPAASPNALAVGAVCWNGGLEPFSSRGPTIDGRVKPDLVAPDNVSTVTYGPALGFGCEGDAFPGTSASAPHVAGAAALVAQRFPTATPADLQAFLEGSAIDAGEPGRDSAYGAGLLHLPDLPEPVVLAPGDVASVGRNEAVVHATVDPRGADTGTWFDLGTTTAYGRSIGAGKVGADAGATDVTARLTDLEPGTTYHYRVVATNLGGSVSGSDQSFETLPDRPPTVKALSAAGRHGRRVQLRYRLADDGGEARTLVEVHFGPFVVFKLRRPFAAALRPAVRSVGWRAPSGRRFAASGYRFCVRAWDRAGHASAPSCARIRLR
jgi:subtilisin family serine protease